MSEKGVNAADAGAESKASKIVRERKPKVKRGPGSFRYGAATAAPTNKYGPCSFEVTIATRMAIGTTEEAGPIRTFCESFNRFPQLCTAKSYSAGNGNWTISVDLATDGNDVDDTFISEMFRTLKDVFDESPVLKREFGAGKARYFVLNGGTTVEAGDLN